MGRLDGKVVVVTGAASGIGAVTARRVAREGARTVLADIDGAGAHRVADDITATGGQALALEFDLADPASIRMMVTETVNRFGGIDVLDNNAAATTLAARDDLGIDEADPAVWDRTMTINVRGTMVVIQAVLPHLVAGGNGSIINMSSAAGLTGDLRNPAYSASKAAIISLTRHVAVSVGKQGVRCNAIAPGLIVTEASGRSMQGARQAMMLRHHLSPRLGVPEDVASAVVFLASDESAFITGQTLRVDGGLLAHQPFYADLREPVVATADCGTT